MARALSMLILIMGLSALGAGCSTTYDHAPGRGVSLENLKTTATFDIVGPTEGSAGGTSILFGLFKIGFENKSGDWGTEGAVLGFGGFGFGGKAQALNAAQYNAIENLPAADALLAPRWNIEMTNYLLWSTIKATVKGKGIRYNATAK